VTGSKFRLNAIFPVAACLLVFVANSQSQPTGNLSGSSNSRPPGSLEATLNAYSELTGKTVLRASALPKLPESVADNLPDETNAAVAFIEGRLREQGIELIQDGPLFVRAVQPGWSNSPSAVFLATLKPLHDDAGSAKGTVQFDPAELEQVLSIYARLRSRTILRTRALPNTSLNLKTRREMTNEQVGYGITALLALNGIAAIDDGRKFVQLVPINRWREVVTASPKANPDAAEMDPLKLPKIKPEPPNATLDRLSLLYLRVLGQQPPWTPRPVDKLVEFYAELTEQKASASRSHGQIPVLFEITTPLTKQELLYAIETTLNLEGLAITSTGKQQISVISLAEQRRRGSEKKLNSEKP
jgi:hypothetical protein